MKRLAAIVVAALALAGSANAQTTQTKEEKKEGTQLLLEAVEIPQNQEKSFVRPNLFYKIGVIDGYSFIEFYADKNYFNKNMLTYGIGRGFSAASEIVTGSDTTN